MEQRIKKELEYFDIGQIHWSGQCFRMVELGDGWISYRSGQSRTGNPDPETGSVGDDRIFSHFPAKQHSPDPQMYL